MKTKYAVQANRALNQLAQLDKTNAITLSGKTRLLATRLLRLMRTGAEDFEEQRVTLVKQYGSFDESINDWKVKGESAQVEWSAEIDKLLETELPIEVIQFTLEDIGVDVRSIDKGGNAKNKVPFDLLADLDETGLLLGLNPSAS